MRLLRTFFWLTALAFLGGSLHAAEKATTFPPVETILSNLVARARTVAIQKDPIFAYKQTTVIEELDSDGAVKERKEKLYDVKLVGGLPRAKLLLVNGKELTGKALKDEEEKDRKRAQRFEEKKKAGKDEEVEVLISRELIARYWYQLQGREEYNGRMSWVISFRPRSDDLPVDKMQDRVLNKLSGLIWVDCEDYEVARADLRLAERVKLFGGFIGALDVFDLEMNRAKSPQGAWYNHHGSLRVEGRKLFSPIRFKARESAAGFELLTK